MSNIVSANALLHFTKSIDNIVNIISNGFYPKCCLENLEFIHDLGAWNSSPLNIAIPMVCFCDIPLSQTGTHKRNYGGYAIGLSKEWGEKNGINPVLYELPNSNAVNIIKECLSNTLSYPPEQNLQNPKSVKKINEIGSEILFFLCYLKPYEGRKWDGNGFNGERIKFYDEREWRYVPDYIKIRQKSLKPYMLVDDFLNVNKREAFNKSLENDFKLEFAPSDIKYIIVGNESDVLHMADNISQINLNCSDNDKKLLITKIISMERIQQDF